MIDVQDFLSYLEIKGYRSFSGVPCSFFRSINGALQHHPSLAYSIAPNEGSALAIASGAYLTGNRSGVFIQNSGVGNLINPLTSLNLIYKIPVLIFVSGRAYGTPDEPQHEIMGKKMGALFDALEIPHWDLPPENYRSVLDTGLAVLEARKIPVVFFVRKGTFEESEPLELPSSHYPMTRLEAIKIIHSCLSKSDAVFATTGMPSRELFSVGDRPGNFYMQGSMGHVASLALGTAMAQPERRVVILDGDGAFLMHMGTVSTLGHYAQKNVYHFVLDNESYETTGNQATTSRTTDFEGIARACGYRATFGVSESRELQNAMPKILSQNGPLLVRIKINKIPSENTPRITTRYTASDITGGFSCFLKETSSTI